MYKLIHNSSAVNNRCKAVFVLIIRVEKRSKKNKIMVLKSPKNKIYFIKQPSGNSIEIFYVLKVVV